MERVEDARQAALISTRLPWASGEARLDLEYHGNSMPFPFGTAYAGGRFWLDRSYVDSRASARRLYRRQALYLQQSLGEAHVVDAHWQRVRSTRAETLLGFFDPLNAVKLRGYYRLIDERNAQADAGLRLRGRNSYSSWTHRWSVAWLRHGQDRAFAGPQNIGGFNLDLAQPVFPEDLTALKLSPRFVFESYREQGLGAASSFESGPWELRFGARRSRITVESSVNPAVQEARVIDVGHTTLSAGAGWRWSAAQRVWLARTESFQPNRGRLRSGAYLPPSEGLQWELGWERRVGNHYFAMQVFDLRQSNLPARDPGDSDSFVVVGANRSRGLTASAGLRQAAYDLSGAITWQRVRVEDPVSASQGQFIVGVPATYGVLTAVAPSRLGRWTAQVRGAASLPGDTQRSFRAPGYAVWNFGWEAPTADTLRWGARVENAFDRRYVRALTGADNVWQGERRKFRVWMEAVL